MTNLSFLTILGQQAATGQTNPLVTLLPLVLVFVIFYFFMIRPQMKKQKEMNNYRNALKRGDKVITTGGLYGRVLEVKDNYIMMDAGGDVKLKVDKNALLKDPSADDQN
ncbi:MAG TPA: preprotein translocase subunit YajC [Bacteroidales bacterium]|jgi:preprotein translocase subunit YajC|nr:MAG: preprotein translocase subunit YajC [Bacteroidetes bacterium ADurb.Bin145]HOU02200.1 preprotein translocase subunit YajC [Bacteroidales bacterium]HQK68670.1 preprotein translocase subunit YajC [Bacteroidales bacterium]